MAFKNVTAVNLDPFIKQPDDKGGEYTLTDWYGYCLAYAENVFGYKYLAKTALGAWNACTKRHTDRVFPKGVYFHLWFSHWGTYDGVYQNWGHVVVCYIHPITGVMQIWSSPVSHKPYADTYASISEVESKYRAKFLGWTEDIVGKHVIDFTPDPVTNTLQANQRRVATTTGVNGRSAPSTSASILKEYAKGDILDFKGYVKGEAVSGNNIWYVGAYSQTFWWSGAFENPTTTGLQSLDAVVPPPIPEPTPVPTPLPTYSPSFTKELDCVTSVAQVNTTNYQLTDFPNPPKGVVLHDFGTEGVDTLQSSLNQFKALNTTAPHFVVSGSQIIQTGKLNWRMYHAGPQGNDKIGIECDPNLDTTKATQASLDKLLRELDAKFGKLTRYKHSEFMATSCGDDVPMNLFSLDAMYPVVTPPTPPVLSPTDEEQNRRLSAIEAFIAYIKSWFTK